MKLRIGHLSTFYHTAILLMADEGLQRELGADVEWRLFGTGPAIVEAFEKGLLDIAYAGLPPILIGIDRAVNIKCIAGGHIEGTVLCSRRGPAGFPETKDLGVILAQFRGEKIGVPGKGSIHDVILSDCLLRYDLKEKIKVINFRWADQLAEAVIHDEVAAAFGTPALAAAIMYYAGGRVLYPPSLLWPDNPSYGIIVSGSFLELSRDLLRRFLLLHERATSVLRENPREAAAVISRVTGFAEKEMVLNALRISPKYCAKLTGRYIDSTLEFARAMKSMGYIQCDISADKIFETSLIDEIHPEEDHYQASSLLS